MTETANSTGKSGSRLPKVLFVLAVVALILGALWWWFNRPIDPVVLSAAEKQVVEEKVEAIQQPAGAGELPPAAEPSYVPGVRHIEFTQRELNGLLHEHTTLGDQVKFELATDAIHARVEMDLDEEVPLIGGNTLKAKARFLVHEDDTGAHFVIEDVSVWGISLPNEWLGGLKGRNLINELLGGKTGRIAGVKSFKVKPGKVRIELKE